LNGRTPSTNIDARKLRLEFLRRIDERLVWVMQEKLGMGLEDEVGEGETELEDEEGKGEEDLIIFEEEGSEEDLTSEQEVAEVEDDEEEEEVEDDEEEEEEDLMSTYIPHPIPFFLSSQKHPTNFFLLGFDY